MRTRKSCLNSKPWSLSKPPIRDFRFVGVERTSVASDVGEPSPRAVGEGAGGAFDLGKIFLQVTTKSLVVLI